ncbi:AtpZ/AtpI family protein [[Clostridium] saccharogumia]|uniref:AtpZ/AtpI family protein n=1 Tax=Thomasclavelia saccharogumia TaxID=341225 RepID=UPI001D089730|nr:AtpZ/AtpI family protein [Thomasclavelia saccharogumia]MCB6706880.1 AtpZ/AtpI family protein [Thomasclavelia saccharogumia]
MNQEKKKLLKDLFFCLQLGFQIIGIFLLAVVIGMQLDKYFKTRPTILLILLFVAFGYVIKILLGAGKR